MSRVFPPFSIKFQVEELGLRCNFLHVLNSCSDKDLWSRNEWRPRQIAKEPSCLGFTNVSLWGTSTKNNWYHPHCTVVGLLQTETGTCPGSIKPCHPLLLLPIQVQPASPKSSEPPICRSERTRCWKKKHVCWLWMHKIHQNPAPVGNYLGNYWQLLGINIDKHCKGRDYNGINR